MRITIQGKGDREAIVLRGADNSQRMIQVKHDFYTIEVRPMSPAGVCMIFRSACTSSLYGWRGNKFVVHRNEAAERWQDARGSQRPAVYDAGKSVASRMHAVSGLYSYVQPVQTNMVPGELTDRPRLK